MDVLVFFVNSRAVMNTHLGLNTHNDLTLTL